MSDYEVTLVNNKMSEFYVKFKGPIESECAHVGGVRQCGGFIGRVNRPGLAGLHLHRVRFRSRDCDVISQGCGAIGRKPNEQSTPPTRPLAPNQS